MVEMNFINIWSLTILSLLMGCVSPYDFEIAAKSSSIVVDGYISNQSYEDAQRFPADGRYFKVRIKELRDVINTRNEWVSDAEVHLEVSDKSIHFFEPQGEGLYLLLDQQFKADSGKYYRLIVQNGEDIFESSWESLPSNNPPIGELHFEEDFLNNIEYVGGEPVLVTKKSLSVYAHLTQNNQDRRYMVWDFDPHWLYVAPLTSTNSPQMTCWATNASFLQNYVLALDHHGDYDQRLFEFETIRNERIYDELTVLIHQYVVNPGFYYFLNDLQIQSTRGGIFDTPPYNAGGNFKTVKGSESQASGYFAVVNEQARRWYFDRTQLSYYMASETKSDCLKYWDPRDPEPAPECLRCLEYTRGIATNVKPNWWK